MTRGGSKPRAEAPAKHDIRVPVSPAEHAELLDYASAAQQPLATYLRERGLEWGRKKT